MTDVSAPPSHASRVRDAYAAAAARYARWVAPGFAPVVRSLLGSPTPPAGPGLDVGSGTGLAVRVWRDLVPDARLIALDLTPAMLGYAAGLPRVAADASALPFPDGSFQSLVSVFALHHLSDPAAALGEWARVLAPGGALRVATWGPQSPTLWDVFDEAAREIGLEQTAIAGPALFSKAEPLASAASGTGFTEVAVATDVAAFQFADTAAYWRWRTAFPGAARTVAACSRQQRAALWSKIARRVVAWPRPLVSRHAVLYLRARRG
jgi:demethylmenaquinone methyltransferase/2-methoxy-6-polyprenyl-1,4-benzoquinol methylase